MEVRKTDIPDLLVVKPQKFTDARGFFLESYNRERFLSHGIKNDFIQDNFSSSQFGVIRGLHYQLAPYGQAKLVQVLKGKILDVVVDLRKDSPTFGKTFCQELSEENGLQLMIPRGFAHGFSVLSPEVLFCYKCDNLYHKAAERGIKYDDPYLAISWGVAQNEAIISDKDRMHPLFKDAEYNF